MKTNQLNKYILIALLIVLVLFSVYVAFITYRHYSILARGTVGLVLLYLLFSFTRYSDVSINTLLISPPKAKFFLFAFVDPIIAYWATMQIIEMILFYIKR